MRRWLRWSEDTVRVLGHYGLQGTEGAEQAVGMFINTLPVRKFSGTWRMTCRALR